MRELTIQNIIDEKMIKQNYPQVFKNPYFLDKPVSFCGQYEDNYRGEIERTLIYQIDGTNHGVVIHCKITDDNQKLVNGYDFPFLTEKQKNLSGMDYVNNLSHYRNAKPCYDWVEKMSKKYGLDEEIVKCCGNIEPIYRKLAESQVKISPIAEIFLRNYESCEKVFVQSLTDKEKECYLSMLCDLSSTSYILSQELLKLSQKEEYKEKVWELNGDKDIQADRLYVIKHIYDVDGGFGDAIHSEDILFTTLDKNLAEAYISKYSHPVVYDRPYNDLYHGQLTLTTIPFIHSMDISKVGPEIFGGVNTINEKDVEKVDISHLDEEEEML